MTTLRIISGILAGKKIKLSNSSKNTFLRPIPEKVRESIFSIIGTRILKAKILDLFAGSGIFSFESLSRGASETYMIESNKYSINDIYNNINYLKLDSNCKIYFSDVIKLIIFEYKKQIVNFDIIFIDPPYIFDFKTYFWQKLTYFIKKDTLIIYRCKKSNVKKKFSPFIIKEIKEYKNMQCFFIIPKAGNGI